MFTYFVFLIIIALSVYCVIVCSKFSSTYGSDYCRSTSILLELHGTKRRLQNFFVCQKIEKFIISWLVDTCSLENFLLIRYRGTYSTFTGHQDDWIQLSPFLLCSIIPNVKVSVCKSSNKWGNWFDLNLLFVSVERGAKIIIRKFLISCDISKNVFLQ